MKTLGEGAFGAVHLAEVREEDFVQVLAVKWLHDRWSQSAEYGKRLRDEARLLALLRHQAIVRVHGLTRIDGRLAVLMEAVDGADLGRVQQLPPRAALEVCAAVADALDAAWSEVPPGSSGPLHVVHRDIKPSNVMVTPRGAVKVMDFGVARASFDAREAETRSQQFGTARYMAPERWLEGVANAPSDVFSLGVTVLELLTGDPVPQPRLSREGFDSDLGSALDRLAADSEIRELLASMVSFRPEDRPDAAEVARAATALAERTEGEGLRFWAETTVPTLRNPGEVSTLTGTVVHEESGASVETLTWTGANSTSDIASPVPEIATAPPPRRPARGRSLLLLLVGLVGLGVVALGFAARPLASRTGPSIAAVAPEPAPNSAVAVPTPEPSPAPPVPESLPEPVPEPAPVATAAIQPVPRPRPAPVPDPEPTAVPTPAPSCTGTLVITAAPGILVETPRGPVTSHRAVDGIPCGAIPLTVVRGQERTTCEIAVVSGRNSVTVNAEGRCSQ